MKNLFFIFFTVLTIGAQAQGNLQFNQVLTFQVNTTNSNVYTVPAGKVAKIVKSVEERNFTYKAWFTLNGKNYYHGASTSTNHTTLDGMWLTAGDIIGSNVGPDHPTDIYIFLSIIEYNVIAP